MDVSNNKPKKGGKPVRQEKDTTNQTGGKHFTRDDRIRLESLDRALFPGKKKPNYTKLAELLGKHRTTISRQYAKGTVMNFNSQLEQFPVYSATKAQDAATEAAVNKGPKGKLTNTLALEIKTLILEEKYSPYVVTVHLKKKYPGKWIPCERTIYYAIKNKQLGVSHADLPYKRTQAPVKYPPRMSYHNARGRPISERPQAANDRTEYGHWEGDLVVGGTGKSPACLLVFTERMTRRQIIRRLPSRCQKEVKLMLDALERELLGPLRGVKTITFDNGCEFLDFAALEQSCLRPGKRFDVFYARAYRASDRGSNENANRVIRRFIPKGADISTFTDQQIQAIEDWMNALPRKLLDDLSAAEKVELYFKELAA